MKTRNERGGWSGGVVRDCGERRIAWIVVTVGLVSLALFFAALLSV